MLAQLHALALHRRDRLHTVGGHLREHRQLDLCKGLRRRARALVELLNDGEHEPLLVGVALKLIEHLDSAPSNLLVVAAPVGGEAEQQCKEPGVEVELVAGDICGGRLVE